MKEDKMMKQSMKNIFPELYKEFLMDDVYIVHLDCLGCVIKCVKNVGMGKILHASEKELKECFVCDEASPKTLQTKKTIPLSPPEVKKEDEMKMEGGMKSNVIQDYKSMHHYDFLPGIKSVLSVGDVSRVFDKTSLYRNASHFAPKLFIHEYIPHKLLVEIEKVEYHFPSKSILKHSVINEIVEGPLSNGINTNTSNGSASNHLEKMPFYTSSTFHNEYLKMIKAL